MQNLVNTDKMNITTVRQYWADNKATIYADKVEAENAEDAIKVPKLRFKEYNGKDEWQVKKIKDFAFFQKGKSHDKVVTSDGNGNYTVVDTQFISSNGEEQKATNKSLTPLKSSDIAIVMRAPKKDSLAKCFYVPKDNTFTVNKDVGRLKIDENNPLFCYYQINKNKSLKKFDNSYKTKNLSKKMVKNCEIFLPSIEEQNKIAETMQDVENALLVQRKKVRKATLLAKEKVAKILQQKDWKYTTLNELVTQNIVQLSRGDIVAEHTRSSIYNYPIYNGKNVEPNKMPCSNSYNFNKELIIWNINGGANITYIPKQKCNITTDCGIIEFLQNKFSYRFAFEILKMQENDNKQSIENRVYPLTFSTMYKLPLISIEEQIEFVAMCDTIYKSVKLEEKALEKLMNTKNKLIDELFV